MRGCGPGARSGHLGEDPGSRAAEVSALRAGLDLGMTLIDTAEMYGHGAAEEVVAEAVSTTARLRSHRSATCLYVGHANALRFGTHRQVRDVWATCPDRLRHPPRWPVADRGISEASNYS